MKSFNIIMAVIGGAIAGAALGLLFAPEKGTELRERIAQMLRDKGINLNGKQLDDLASEIAGEIKEKIQ